MTEKGRKGLALKHHVICVLKKMLFIGGSVQIVFGILWMVTNLMSVQEFGDSCLYMEGGISLVGDGRLGVLYPVLLFILKGVGDFVGLPWYPVLYVMQLAAGFIASLFFVDALPFGKGKEPALLWRLWTTLSLMTIPAVMQCHLAILPNSFTGSVYLVILGLALRLLEPGKTLNGRELLRLGGLWLLAALLMPEYRFLGGAAVLFVILWKRGRELWRFVVLFAAMGGIVSGILALTLRPGAYLQVQDSLALRAVSRFVWPGLQEYHSAWPKEITDVISWDEAGEISATADGIDTIFAPRMEQALGRGQAKEAYWKLAKTALHIQSKKIAVRILWDGACYGFSPYMLTRQLEGMGYPSYSGRNYEIMKAAAPGLTRLYVSYEGWWFATGLVLAAFTRLLTLKRKKPDFLGEVSFLVGNALLMVCYYTMRGSGIMDYKLTGFVTALWMLVICCTAFLNQNGKNCSEKSTI